MKKNRNRPRGKRKRMVPSAELTEAEKIILDKEQTKPLRDLAQVEEDYRNGVARVVLDQGRHLLPELASSLESSRYKIDPQYQRQSVWPDDKKSRLIESLIANIPIPPIFFYEYEYSQFEVMDGLQRLTAISDFYSGKLILEGLELWPELNGLGYEGLPETIRRAVDRRFISSVTILKENLQDEQAHFLRTEVFARINTGGTPLNSQELRNAAVVHGPLAGACQDLRSHPSFLQMWGMQPYDPDAVVDAERLELDQNRMEDIEAILRFFVNRLRLVNKPKKTLNQLMDDYWVGANRNLNQVTVDGLAETFRDTCDLLVDVMGDDAIALFRRRRNKHVRLARPSMMMYDCNMQAFSRLLGEADQLRDNRDRIHQSVIEVFETDYDLFDGRKTDINDVSRRIDRILEVILDVVAK